MEIRHEQTQDYHAISRLTTEAFKSVPYSGGNEAAIIENLRNAGDLTLSLVAVEYGNIVGHVAFSPVTIHGDTDSVFENWYGLGPVAVQPLQQRQGIGSALINEGLQKLREMDAGGCALIGDPGYYHRFGFVSDGKLHYQQVPPDVVQWMSFSGQQPAGRLEYRPAFES